MQRRAAAIYVVFFVVVAIGAYSLTTVAEEPTVSIDGQSYQQGDTFQASGTAWMVNVSDGSGELSSVNRSARFTTSIANNSTILFQNGVYRPVPEGGGGGGAGTGTGSGTGSASASGTGTGGAGTPGTVGTSAPTAPGAAGTPGTTFLVVIDNSSASGNASGGNASGANASNVSTFTLREAFDVESQLQSDPEVQNSLLTAENGTRYVQYQNGTTQPLGEYLPTPETQNVSAGDSFPYAGNQTTVESVNSTGATLEWRGPLKRSQELEEGANVTLGSTTYVTHFPNNQTAVLSQNVSGYQAELDQVEHFHERILGLWGIVIISLFAAILIVAMAYMPVRG